MLFSDTYNELKFACKGNYHEKGSKFNAYAFPVHSQLDINNKLEYVKKIEKNANHYCFAFVLHPDKSSIKYNDDGEPSSTAGKPILGQINSHDLTNTLIITVRYFGGTKLGIPGLIRSYKNAAADAIINGTIITKKIKELYEIFFTYEEMNYVMKIIKDFNLNIIDKEFDINCRILISISKNQSENVVKVFRRNYKLDIKYIKTI